MELIPGADDDHKPGHPLQNEFVLFHEYGHLLAHRLKIWSGNNWVNELVPNIFMNTYLVQSRTDLDFVLQDRLCPIVTSCIVCPAEVIHLWAAISIQPQTSAGRVTHHSEKGVYRQARLAAKLRKAQPVAG